MNFVSLLLTIGIQTHEFIKETKKYLNDEITTNEYIGNAIVIILTIIIKALNFQ